MESKEATYNKSLVTKDNRPSYDLECRPTIDGPAAIDRTFTVSWSKNGTALDDTRYMANATVLTIKNAGWYRNFVIDALTFTFNFRYITPWGPQGCKMRIDPLYPQCVVKGD